MIQLSPSRLTVLLGAAAIALAACGATAPEATAPQPTETTAPSDPATTPPDSTSAPAQGDCSAASLTLAAPAFDELPAATRATAEFLLDAALRCDEQLLVTAAEEGQTRLTFGNVEPGTFFGLPEPEGEPIYAIIARLIAGTSFAQADGGEAYVFPAVTTGNGTDEDWQTLVSSGLYTQEEVDELRAAGDGYLGWRLGIDADGSWTFFVAGD